MKAVTEPDAASQAAALTQESTRALTWLADYLVGRLGLGKSTCSRPSGMTDAIVGVAARTKLLPLLGVCLERDSDAPVPDWIRAVSRDAAKESRRRVEWLKENAAELGRLFEAASITAVIRKGLAVQGLFPEPGARPFGDLDIWIALEHRDAAHNLLIASGFTASTLTRAQKVFLELGANTRNYCKERVDSFLPGVSVDLSTTIMLSTFQDKELQSKIWNDSKYFSTGLKCLDSYGMLIDAVYNLYVTHTSIKYIREFRFQRLAQLFDILLLLDARLRDSPIALEELSACPIMQRPTNYALSVCSNLFRGFRHSSKIAHFLESRADEQAHCEFGLLELGTPLKWKEPVNSRILLDEIPYYVPADRSPK